CRPPDAPARAVAAAFFPTPGWRFGCPAFTPLGLCWSGAAWTARHKSYQMSDPREGGCRLETGLAIFFNFWGAAWSPFAFPLFAELVALFDQPYVAARDFASQHLAIEPQALKASFHLRDLAGRFRDFSAVLRQTRQVGAVLL